MKAPVDDDRLAAVAPEVFFGNVAAAASDRASAAR